MKFNFEKKYKQTKTKMMNNIILGKRMTPFFRWFNAHYFKSVAEEKKMNLKLVIPVLTTIWLDKKKRNYSKWQMPNKIRQINDPFQFENMRHSNFNGMSARTEIAKYSIQSNAMTSTDVHLLPKLNISFCNSKVQHQQRLLRKDTFISVLLI